MKKARVERLAESAKTRANRAKGEPRFDCVSYDFKGNCRKLDALYCKDGECSWCKTMDDLLPRKRAALPQRVPPQVRAT